MKKVILITGPYILLPLSDNVIRTVTRLRVARFEGLAPRGRRDFSNHGKVQIGCGTQPALYSHPPSAEVKSEQSYTSTPPTQLHGVNRKNIILFHIFLRFAVFGMAVRRLNYFNGSLKDFVNSYNVIWCLMCYAAPTWCRRAKMDVLRYMLHF